MGMVTVKLSQSALRAAVWDKTDGRCWYCGVLTNPFRTFCIDHLHPKSKGGTLAFDNLVPCCRTCNIRKQDRPLENLRRLLALANGVAEFTFYFEKIA